MRELWDVMWHRLNVIQGVVADANARIVAVGFYFTFMLPFGLLYTLTSDPLRRKTVEGDKAPGQSWLDRDPTPNDIESARQQG